VSIALIFLVSLVTILFCDAKPPEQKQKQKPLATQQATEEIQTEQAGKGFWPLSFEKEIGGEVQAETVADKLITRNFVIIFDDSGSMAGPDADGNPKIDTAKNAVVEWSKSVPAGANVGLVSFHGGDWSLQPLTSTSKERLISTVLNFKHGGGTPLSEAFRTSFFMLTKQGLKQLGYGEYTMVVITDGEASSRFELNKWVHFVLDNSPIQIYTIGFGIGTDHTLNQPGLTQYKPAENLAELQAGLKEVLAEAETFDETEFK
jgi:hypothetical protein